MKKIYYSLIFVLIGILSIGKVEAISYNLTIYGDNQVKVGESINLTADYWVGNDMIDPSQQGRGTGPISHTNVTSDATWTSNKTDVATVSSNGEVTGVSAGKAKIKATYTTDGVSREDEVEITVLESDTNPNRKLVIVDKNLAPAPILVAGRTGGTIVYLYDIPASKKSDIIATSSDESIVKVTNIDKCEYADHSMDNVVIIEYELKKVGTAVLTVSVAYDGETYEDRYTMTVAESSYTIKLTDNNDKTLPTDVEVGQKVQLKATMYMGTLAPTDITSEITWTSSDSSIATVENGLVTAVKAGMVTISAKANIGGEEVTETYALIILGDKRAESPDSPVKNPICKADSDGLYYDNRGVEVDSQTFKERCTCVKIGNSFFDDLGKEVSEEDYNTACNPKTGSSLPFVLIISLLLILTGIYSIYNVYNNKFYKV